MKPIYAALSVLIALLVSTPLIAQTAKPKPVAATVAAAVEAPAKKAGPAPSARTGPPLSLAPLTTKPTPSSSSHAPFEDGDCKICHQNSDPKQPGPVVKKGPALCLNCHEEFAGILKRPHTHDPARTDCNACHNPHNAAYPKLLLQEPQVLCIGCHDKIGKVLGSAKVQHKAVSTGAQCAGCHNPHGSAVAKLLVQLPMDLCLSCHNTDTMTNAEGKKMQNIKALLDNNKVRHGPVRDKNCSGCHQPHGSDHFRLLEDDYPKEFYAPYSAKAYALCFSCHNDDAFATPKTTSLTKFRNGDNNLHFIHLQQPGRGRTCRACHEVHASNQRNQIRDGVPYGSSGWMLKLNYKETATGGSCEKTCHAEKSYEHTKPRSSVAPKTEASEAGQLSARLRSNRSVPASAS